MDINYRIQFYEYWHIGSGLSGGIYADNIVLRDREGFPFIPGKTIKGLLRDAGELICKNHSDLVDISFIDDIFGKKTKEEKNANEEGTKPGNCHFSNAVISPFIRAELLSESNGDSADSAILEHLFATLGSTSIVNGVAKDRSLRVTEVVIPIDLSGHIGGFSDDIAKLDQLKWCMKGVKRMGLGRNRGFGRCEFTIIDQ